MSLESDTFVDRRRLKRALTFWRLAALAVAGALGAVAVGNLSDVSPVGDYVAEVKVESLIVEDTARIEAIAKVAKNDRAKALVVSINSPGGTVVGGESLYRALRKVAEKKPVVAVMGELATSAGYMVALGAERIIAHDGTLTGSIGVLLQTADVTPLMGKIGVKPETIKSSPLKAQPNPLEPFSDAARAAIRGVVMDMYDMFAGLVAERRKMDPAAVAKLADGRVFTGRQAAKNGLVDQLGGLDEARSWLTEKHDISAELPLKTITPKKDLSFLAALGGDSLARMGVGAIESVFGKTVFSEGLRLDGLVSVWHPGWR